MIGAFVEKCRRPVVGGWLLLGVCLLGSGCSKPPATVSGMVSYKGKPLTSGSVSFFCEQDNLVINSKIDSDGNYKVVNVPPGRAKIAVVSAPDVKVPIGISMSSDSMGGPPGEKYVGNPALKAGKTSSTAKTASTAKKKASEPKYVKIPDSYSDPEKSGLAYTVKSGKNTHDI